MGIKEEKTKMQKNSHAVWLLACKTASLLALHFKKIINLKSYRIAP